MASVVQGRMVSPRLIPLAFVLSTVSLEISGNRAEFALIKNPLDFRKQCLRGFLFDVDTYFVSDTFKRVCKIKDLHTTPVPTLLSMAIDPFFEIFILCRCFFSSEIIALN